MARLSSDREDLMAEAVTLVPRIAFLLPHSPREIVAGGRADGRWSIFFGGDPVYQFDMEHRLRRAFIEGVPYRSQGTTLARLTRQESQHETVLLRHDLTADELTQFFRRLRLDLQPVADAISHGTAQILNCIPPGSDCLAELADSIQNVLKGGDALSPALIKR